MADAQRLDPFRAFKFRVIVPGFPGTLAFQKVSGLKISVAATEYREGTDTNTVRKLPGLATYPNIVLSRGLTDNVSLVRWMREIVDLGNEAQLPDDGEFRREVEIQVLSRRGELVRSYLASSAWAMDLELDELDAQSNNVLIEKLELAHEGLSINENGDIGAQA